MLSPITLGTAQLGMSYGITNTRGLLSDNQALAFIERALRHGVHTFDTARSYGSAEARLGRALKSRPVEADFVITKLAPLTDLSDIASAAEVAAAVDLSVARSLEALQRPHLDVAMFHRSADMVRANGAALAHLGKLAERGVVREIGASVYTPDEAVACVADERIRHLQIPFNLLDRRWTADPFAEAVGRRDDLQIHVRGVFLQGLLASDVAVWPSWMVESGEIVRGVQELTKLLNRRNPVDLCMAYVRAFPWVTTLVLGVDTESQLDELVHFANTKALSPAEIKKVHRILPPGRDRVIDPRQW